MFCSKCGMELREGSKFCTVCGEKVIENINFNERESVNSESMAGISKEYIRDIIIIIIVLLVIGMICLKMLVWQKNEMQKKQVEIEKFVDTWSNEEVGWSLVLDEGAVNGDGEGKGDLAFVWEDLYDTTGWYNINTEDKKIQIDGLFDEGSWLEGEYSYSLINDDVLVLKNEDGDEIVLHRN